MMGSFDFRKAPRGRQTRIFYDARSYSAFPHVVRLEGNCRETVLIPLRPPARIPGRCNTAIDDGWRIGHSPGLGVHLDISVLGLGEVGHLQHRVVPNLALARSRSVAPARSHCVDSPMSPIKVSLLIAGMVSSRHNCW